MNLLHVKPPSFNGANDSVPELPLQGKKGEAIVEKAWPLRPDAEDWMDLALLALDHAGCSVKEQMAIWTIVGRGERR